MLKFVTKITNSEDRQRILSRLNHRPVENAWAIQDMKHFADDSKLFYVDDPDFEGLDYLLISGHPSTRRGAPTLILGGRLDQAHALLVNHLPHSEWIMRETPAALLQAVTNAASDAKIYQMQRMQVTRSTFSPVASKFTSRRLIESDASALASFFNDPAEAAHGYRHWLRGGYVFGTFDGDTLGAIATAIVRSKDVWVLVGIETRKDQRGMGLGKAVTSAICAAALEDVPLVSLTMADDNAPAIAAYKKVGFEAAEKRLWVDNGTGIGP